LLFGGVCEKKREKLMPSPFHKKEKNGLVFPFSFFFWGCFLGVSVRKRGSRETKEEKKRSFVYFNI
jgi:hypothetical protein